MPPMKRSDVQRNLRRGVYVIPTSLTVLNLFFGFRCMINSTRALQAITDGRFEDAENFFTRAAIALLIAAIFDTFDGLIARQLGATSEFGKEYDSLADVVTFGAAPAVLVYAWGLQILNNLGGGIAFLFLVAVSLRLARFNVMTGKTDYRYFVGLPSPAGALTIAAVVNYAPTPVTNRDFAFVMMALTIFVAFAMVSPIRWRSQKGLNLQKERSLMYFVVLALIVGLMSKWPREFLFFGAIAYLTSGPLLKLWSIAFPKAPGSTPDEAALEPVEAP
jgi:CDP-diacylglycerol---serine O-phosphatidyltransferase